MEMVRCKNCDKEISISQLICDCGTGNDYYVQRENGDTNEQSKIKKFKKCCSGHHIDINDYSQICRDCSEPVEPEIYSLCRQCGNEVLVDQLCEKCKGVEPPPPEPIEIIPKLECQSNTLFNPEIKNGDVIGREGNINTTFLNNNAISRKHASFIEENGNWFIKDEGSKYGTKVNWQPIQQYEKVPLKHDTVICLADEIVFVFKMK